MYISQEEIKLTKHGIIDLYAPRHLFKYQKINKYSLSCLKEIKCWASFPQDFNDPFEFKCKSNGKNALEKEIDILINELERFKVVCFAGDPLNTLMWSHYADQHRGMCLGFYNSSVTTPVNYTMEFPEIDFKNGKLLDKQKAVLKILTTKSVHWSYEGERRKFYVPSGPHLVEYPGDLFMVSFGINTTEEDINKVKKILNNQEIIFYKCELSSNSYSIFHKSC